MEKGKRWNIKRRILMITSIILVIFLLFVYGFIYLPDTNKVAEIQGLTIAERIDDDTAPYQTIRVVRATIYNLKAWYLDAKYLNVEVNNQSFNVYDVTGSRYIDPYGNLDICISIKSAYVPGISSKVGYRPIEYTLFYKGREIDDKEFIPVSTP